MNSELQTDSDPPEPKSTSQAISRFFGTPETSDVDPTEIIDATPAPPSPSSRRRLHGSNSPTIQNSPIWNSVAKAQPAPTKKMPAATQQGRQTSSPISNPPPRSDNNRWLFGVSIGALAVLGVGLAVVAGVAALRIADRPDDEPTVDIETDEVTAEDSPFGVASIEREESDGPPAGITSSTNAEQQPAAPTQSSPSQSTPSQSSPSQSGPSTTPTSSSSTEQEPSSSDEPEDAQPLDQPDATDAATGGSNIIEQQVAEPEPDPAPSTTASTQLDQ